MKRKEGGHNNCVKVSVREKGGMIFLEEKKVKRKKKMKKRKVVGNLMCLKINILIQNLPQKTSINYKTTSYCSEFLTFLCATLLAFLLISSLYSLSTPSANFTTPLPTQTQPKPEPGPGLNPSPTTFYDDPNIPYTLQTPIQNWDSKRKQWLSQNPARPGPEKVVMVTGSQPGPCKNPVGDHFLLRLSKNKVDYCRIHGYDIFYNNVLLDPKMFSFWAKYPVIKSAMLAHPDTEWIWWVDSDAAITNMDFNLPLEKYKDYNLIMHGWPNLVFDKKSWTGLNAGVFLIRNCQWSMDLLDKWAQFGPLSKDYESWGKIMKSVFTDKLYAESDDQTGIAYLMVKEGQKWKEKIYLENEYFFEGYWLEIVDKLENISDYYSKIEREVRTLKTRHAEKRGARYRAHLEEIEKGMGIEMRRPFITHFTGCEPCSGKHNEMYSLEKCYNGMNLALNFADNQVLRSYGYFRPDLRNSSRVEPLRF